MNEYKMVWVFLALYFLIKQKCGSKKMSSIAYGFLSVVFVNNVDC